LRQRILVSALGAGAIAVAGLTATSAAAAAPTPYLAGKHAVRVCSATTAAHTAACNAIKLVNDKGVVPASTAPPSTGLTPTGLRDAYKLAGTSAAGRTVAIVDAYGYPNLERDLGVYRSQFGLSACTTANGCLRIINESGGTALPRFNAGWAGEQALDVDAVSATAPDAKIVVVQANSAGFADLGGRRHRLQAARRGGDLEQLQRRRRVRCDVRQLLQPPGDRDHRVHR
jgi:subtilase family serine protease